MYVWWAPVPNLSETFFVNFYYMFLLLFVSGGWCWIYLSHPTTLVCQAMLVGLVRVDCKLISFFFGCSVLFCFEVHISHSSWLFYSLNLNQAKTIINPTRPNVILFLFWKNHMVDSIINNNINIGHDFNFENYQKPELNFIKFWNIFFD